jgi:hypothetical protein
LDTTIALTPPSVREVRFAIFIPLMATKVPTEPEEGENEVMVGGGEFTKTQAAP